MLQRVEQLLVSVLNLDAATAHWARVLGVPPVWRGEHPASGTQHALFRFENAGLALLAPAPGGTHALCEALRARGAGLFGLVFGTPDAKACARAFSARGLAPSAHAPGLARDVESGAFRSWTGFALPREVARGVRLYVLETHAPDALPPVASARATEAAAACAVDHIVLRTRAPEATRALYGDALGLRLALERDAKEWGAHMQFFRVGGVTLEVVAKLAPDAARAERAQSPAKLAPDAARAERAQSSVAAPPPDALWGVAFRVGSADAARARMDQAGLPVSEVRAGRKPGTRVFHLREAEGADAATGVPVLFIEQAR